MQVYFYLTVIIQEVKQILNFYMNYKKMLKQ